MRLSPLLLVTFIGKALGQGDLAGLLQSQPDLSTLLELVSLIPGLADTLSEASNITILAPTNEAFAGVPREIPEGEAIEQMNDTIAIAALLSNHVIKGVYPSDVLTDVPTYAQSLLNSSFVNDQQPFSNFTGGQYSGLVRNGDGAAILSGELAVANVVQADIALGEGITIHVIDDVLRFGAPLQLFTRRDNLLAFNAAVEAADLPLSFGQVDAADLPPSNTSDFTIFVPNDPAFEAIGSVLEGADLETLQQVLSYHVIGNNVIFSPSLGNVTVPSLQGGDLTFTVADDGSAWVNNARIIFPNVILYNGVAHVIDTVLNPADSSFDRASLEPSADAADRVAYPDASSVSELPFSSVSFGTDTTTYTTPELLQTIQAVPTPSGDAETTTTASSSPSVTPVDDAAAGLIAQGALAFGAAIGVAAIMM